MVSRIGIHDSVDAVFPPTALQSELAGVDADVCVVDTDGVGTVDALVTFA
ncbi:hypothetical protein [Halobacterium yunchengense]